MKADIGLIGLAVMGENLVLNMERNGFCAAVYNRTVEKVDNFISGRGAGKKALSGMIILLFLIPLLLCLFSDFHPDGRLDWFGYVAGGLALGYIVLALPLWFRNPNPVIFTPCNFAAAILYLWYIDLATQGNWFLTFALPTTAGFALIVCTVVTLLHYVKRGKLYICGGAFIGLGAWVLGIEYCLVHTFQLAFIGWSVYPLVVLGMFGANLIYLAINGAAREMLARKLFF